MQVGLESYSYAYSAGFGYTELQPPDFVPLSIYDLLDKAADEGLGGLSFALDRFVEPDDADALRQVRAAADARGLFLNGATGGTDIDRLTHLIEVAGSLKCRILRTVIGGAKIGGDRRPLHGRWQSFIEKTREDLRNLAPVAARHQVILAIENHQDVTSDELLRLLREIASPWLGVVLDVANPLGTAEDLDTFYKKVMAYVRGVHLKDYRILTTPSGYRLARTALGDGVIDFPALFDTLRRWHPDLQPTVELAALEARHVRVLEEDFWADYPPRPAHELARTWRLIHRHAVSQGVEWRTPVEQGLNGDAVAAYEEAQVQSSLKYLRQLLGDDLRNV